MENVTSMDYIIALKEAHTNHDSFQMVENLIYDYFKMINHMKKTSLYDVYTYEENITKITTESMGILAYENRKLKKEVNELRKHLGLSKKYEIKPD